MRRTWCHVNQRRETTENRLVVSKASAATARGSPSGQSPLITAKYDPPHSKTCQFSDYCEPNRDIFGNIIIDVVPRFEDFTASRLQTFVSRILSKRGYWFRVYNNPPEHSDVLARRYSADYNVAEPAWGELSKQELGLCLPRFTGLEIIYNHEACYTMGKVVSAVQDADSGSVRVLVRPYECENGHRLATWMAFRTLEGMSLQHARFDTQIQLRELTVCMLGARPNTWLEHEVEFPDGTPSVDGATRPYSHPRFVIARASEAPSYGASGGLVHEAGSAKAEDHMWTETKSLEDATGALSIAASNPPTALSFPVRPPPPVSSILFSFFSVYVFLE